MKCANVALWVTAKFEWGKKISILRNALINYSERQVFRDRRNVNKTIEKTTMGSPENKFSWCEEKTDKSGQLHPT